MKCSKCAAEIPAQSQFCLRCGTPLRTASSMPVSPNDSPFGSLPRQNNRPIIIALLLMALAIVGLGAYVVGSQMMQKSGRNGTGQLVQSPGQSDTGTLVQAPGKGGGGAPVQAPADTPLPKIVQAPNDAPNTADIDDYLKFLKQIEVSKQNLIRRQTADALLLLTQVKALSATIDENEYTNTFKNTDSSMKNSEKEWGLLTSKLNQRTPPQACIELRNKYYDQLGKIQATIFKVNSALAQVQTNPTEAVRSLTDMQGKTSAEVDSSIQTADDALDDVCKKYNLRKEFDIKGDSGSSSLLR